MSEIILYQNMVQLYGKKGEAWYQNLSQHIESINKKYPLINLTPFEHLTYNYVASGTMYDQPIVLKIGYDQTTLDREAAALHVFESVGAVKVYVKGDHFLLLEQMIPGRSLVEKAYDEQSIYIFCDLINQLHINQSYNEKDFQLLSSWLSVFDKIVNIPQQYLEKGRQFRDRLLNQNRYEVLLHGDLHHDNILQHGTSFKIIDPKGIIGPLIYEAALFIINPIRLFKNKKQEELKIIFSQKITLMSSVQKWRIDDLIESCFIESLFAWICAEEDKTETSYFKICVEIFDDLSE